MQNQANAYWLNLMKYLFLFTFFMISTFSFSQEKQKNKSEKGTVSSEKQKNNAEKESVDSEKQTNKDQKQGNISLEEAMAEDNQEVIQETDSTYDEAEEDYSEEETAEPVKLRSKTKEEIYKAENEPIRADEVSAVKKNPELWYVDKTFVGDSVVVEIDTVYNKNKKKAKVKKEAVTRDTTAEALDIPEGFLIALKWFFYLAILAAVILLIIKGNFRSFNFTRNTAIETEITENTTIESASQLQNIGFE